MFEHIQLNYEFEELEATTTDDGRVYNVPQGTSYVKYPSVTTVIGYDKREFFAEWKKQPGNSQKSRLASNRGDIIHEAIEQFLNNEFDNFKHIEDISHRNMLNSMKPYLRKINKIHALEVPLYSHMLKMAGRVDCVAEYNGKLAIIDFKGSNKIKSEKWIENYFQQATTYAIMWQEMTGTPIFDLVIIMGNEAGFCQIFEKKTTDYVSSLHTLIQKYRQATEIQEDQHVV